MARKSTGVYVIDKFNQQYELNEYHLFVQKECAKMQKKGIHIPGSGNTLVYIGELWQKKKLKETTKNERDEKARANAIRDAEKFAREQIAREAQREAEAKAEKAAKAKAYREAAKLRAEVQREAEREAEAKAAKAAKAKAYREAAKLRAETQREAEREAETKEKQRCYKEIEDTKVIKSSLNVNYYSNVPSTNNLRYLKGAQV